MVVALDANRAPDSVRMELPYGVESAHPSLFSLAPSLSLLMVGFYFKSEATLALQRQLEAPHQSRLIRIGRNTGMRPPGDAARDAIRRTRERIYGDCSAWLQTHFCGAFGNGLADAYPVVELVTARTGAPFHIAHSGIPDYEQLIGLRPWPAWVSTQHAALRLAEPDRWLDPPSALRIGGRFDETMRDIAARAMAGGPSQWSLFMGTEDIAHGILGLWTVRHALAGFHARLSELRDLPTSHPRMATAALKRLRETQRQVRFAVDARAIAGDLRDQGALHWASHYMPSDFTLDAEHHEDLHGRSWRKHNTDAITKELAALLRIEQQVREQLEIESSLISSGANLRAQRAVFWLTVVILVLTMPAVLVAVHQLTQH